MTSAGSATAVDLVEFAALSDFQRAAVCASEDAVELLEVDGAVCTVMPSDPRSQLGNRVVGLGLVPFAGNAVFGAVEAFYARYAASFTIVSDLPQLTARGYRRATPWIRFVRGTEPLESRASAPAVAAVKKAERGAFGEACATASHAPEYFAGWVGELVEREGWYCFAARANGAIIATAALYAADGNGWLGLAATQEQYRGRGAQAALLAARVAHARRLGLTTLVTDTADPGEAPGPSHRNIVRAGFRLESVRTNWELPYTGPSATNGDRLVSRACSSRPPRAT
jgi:GNAT superfamily N-acetyltransferase